MTEIGAVDAKAHFSDLLRRVAVEGEKFVVTVRGKPAAMLCPVEPVAPTKESIETFLAELRVFRGSLPTVTNAGESLKTMAREGLE